MANIFQFINFIILLPLLGFPNLHALANSDDARSYEGAAVTSSQDRSVEIQSIVREAIRRLNDAISLINANGGDSHFLIMGQMDDLRRIKNLLENDNDLFRYSRSWNEPASHCNETKPGAFTWNGKITLCNRFFDEYSFFENVANVIHEASHAIKQRYSNVEARRSALDDECLSTEIAAVTLMITKNYSYGNDYLYGNRCRAVLDSLYFVHTKMHQNGKMLSELVGGTLNISPTLRATLDTSTNEQRVLPPSALRKGGTYLDMRWTTQFDQLKRGTWIIEAVKDEDPDDSDIGSKTELRLRSKQNPSEHLTISFDTFGLPIYSDDFLAYFNGKVSIGR